MLDVTSKVHFAFQRQRNLVEKWLEVEPIMSFSRMRSEGSRFTWGSGGEAVFAKFCVCGRNRSQPLVVPP